MITISQSALFEISKKFGNLVATKVKNAFEKKNLLEKRDTPVSITIKNDPSFVDFVMFVIPKEQQIVIADLDKDNWYLWDFMSLDQKLALNNMFVCIKFPDDSDWENGGCALVTDVDRDGLWVKNRPLQIKCEGVKVKIIDNPFID